ncbi:hypothetical protein RchiOBHm_Chr3g0454181 [Rosa chinensis]|uniref:Uncharacterized protein n=1 Tax=Rosa chinensis TaxID=74649 RepID=A0A2P6R6S3_ROSCH|nr:hypothetical protein RchiOBHm_Chr3g0454181 [Rosa chinensis]
MSSFKSKWSFVIPLSFWLQSYFQNLTKEVMKQEMEIATRLVARKEEYERMLENVRMLEDVKEKLEKDETSEMAEASFWDHWGVTSI